MVFIGEDLLQLVCSAIAHLPIRPLFPQAVTSAWSGAALVFSKCYP